MKLKLCKQNKFVSFILLEISHISHNKILSLIIIKILRKKKIENFEMENESDEVVESQIEWKFLVNIRK